MTHPSSQPDIVVDTPTPQEQIAWWEEQYSRQAVKIERLTTERDQLLSALKNAPQCGVQSEQQDVLDWVETWVSNPVGAYSVHALDGLFRITRDKIEALRASRLSSANCAGDDDIRELNEEIERMRSQISSTEGK